MPILSNPHNKERAAIKSSEVPFDPIIALEQFSSEVPES